MTAIGTELEAGPNYFSELGLKRKEEKLLPGFLGLVTHSTRKVKVGESGIQGQSLTKNPNKKRKVGAW